MIQNSEFHQKVRVCQVSHEMHSALKNKHSNAAYMRGSNSSLITFCATVPLLYPLLEKKQLDYSNALFYCITAHHCSLVSSEHFGGAVCVVFSGVLEAYNPTTLTEFQLRHCRAPSQLHSEQGFHFVLYGGHLDRTCFCRHQHGLYLCVCKLHKPND